MKLSEIADKVKIPVGDITSKDIRTAKKGGLITREQEKNLLAELKKADSIWKMPVLGIRRADCLWQQ